MAVQTNTNPASSINIDPAQQLKAKITLPNDPPMSIPGQWGYQSLVDPMYGQGTAQYQSLFNPRVAPNLNPVPLGINPSAWNQYLTMQDRSYSTGNPGQAKPLNQDGSVNTAYLQSLMTPQQQSGMNDQLKSQLGATSNPDSFVGGVGMGQPGFTGDWNSLIQQVYQQDLGRNPDQAGYNYWLNEAKNGNESPSQLVDAMLVAGQVNGERPSNFQPASALNTNPYSPNQLVNQQAANYPQASTSGQTQGGLGGLGGFGTLNGQPDQSQSYSNSPGYGGYGTLNGQPNQNYSTQGNTQSGSVSGAYTDPNSVYGMGQTAHNSNVPVSLQGTPLTALQQQWYDMMDQGRQATAGIDRMPFTFSNYGAVPSDSNAAYNMFYPKTTLTDYQQQMLGNMFGMNQNGQGSSQYYFPKAVADYKTYLQNSSSPPKDIDTALKNYDNSLFQKVGSGVGFENGLPWGTGGNTDNQTMQNVWGSWVPQSNS